MVDRDDGRFESLLGRPAVEDPRYPPAEAGKASGVNAAIREIGGVLGVAILAAVFSHAGGDITGGQAYTDGLRPAVYVGAVVVAAGAVAATLIPRRKRQPAVEPVPALATA